MQESKLAHPELRIGIPLVVVCAIGGMKERVAKEHDYVGPLTLREAVESRHTAENVALSYLCQWVASGIDLGEAQKLWPGFTMPEQVTIFGKERQYRDD